MFLQRAHEHIQNVHENISRAVGGTPLPNNISRAGSQPAPSEPQQQAPPKREATTTTKAEPPAAKPDAPPSAQPEPAAPKVETVEDAKAESKEVGAVCYEDKPKTDDDATAAPVKQEETKPESTEEQPAAAPKKEEEAKPEEKATAPEPEKKEAAPAEAPAETQQSEKKPEAAATETQQPEQPAKEEAKPAPEAKAEAPQPEPVKEEPKPEQPPQETAAAEPEQPRALPDAPAPNCSGMRDNTTTSPAAASAAASAATPAPEKPVAATEAPEKDEAPAPKEEAAPAPAKEEAPSQEEPKRPTREEAKEGLKSYLVGRGYSEEIVNQTVGLFCPVTGKPLCPETGKPLEEKEADKASAEPKEQAKSEETSKDAAPAGPEAPKESEPAPADTAPEQKEEAPAPEPQAESQSPPDCTPIAEQKLENSDDTIRKILTQSRTIALVGASATTGRLSNFMMKFMMDRGYHVIPVNPTAAGSTIYDQHVEASVRAIQQPLDMVYVFTNADTTPIVEDAIFVGAKSVWLQAGMVNDKAGEWARAAGLNYVQNVCPRAEIRRLNIPTVSA